METLEITKLGQEKVINYTNKKTNKPDSFNKVGFQSAEYNDKWFDFTYRGACPLVVGNKYEFEITSREYNGKTYWEAKLPREKKTTGMSPEQFEAIMRELRAINSNILRVWGAVDPQRNITSAGTPVPFPDDDEFQNIPADDFPKF